MTYRIVLDRTLCSGFGSCADAAPSVFRLGEDGVADLVLAETDEASALEAAGSCPMGAISVFDATNGARAA
jgi:ferredoxin